MYRIVEVQSRPNYCLWIKFADGVEGEVDVSDLVGKGVFAAWEDEHEFHRVSIDPFTGTVAWPSGIDLAPDALYHDLAGIATR